MPVSVSKRMSSHKFCDISKSENIDRKFFDFAYFFRLDLIRKKYEHH